eukprot:TRINITY_DN116_c0_g1_i1.p1 TRINITY_DN116_c0_g1~~TRINITY_DN116_c0_g1_i1.p1  ORF type:complete len:677 (-),score=168.07 TRINITY_DN116_c0_g1_i1:1604-3634(-)
MIDISAESNTPSKQTHSLTLSFLNSLQQDLQTDVARLKDELNTLKLQRNANDKTSNAVWSVNAWSSADQKITPTQSGEDIVSKFNLLKNIKATTTASLPTLEVIDLVENPINYTPTVELNGYSDNANIKSQETNGNNYPSTPKTAEDDKNSIIEDERNDIIVALKQILESFNNASTTNNPVLTLTSPTTSIQETPSSVPIEIQTPPTSPEIRVLPLLNTIKRRTVEVLRENEKLKEALANPPPATQAQTWGPGKRIRAERGNRSGSLTATTAAAFTTRIPRKLSAHSSLPFPRSKGLSTSTPNTPTQTATTSLSSQASSSTSSSSTTPISVPVKNKAVASPRSISPSSSPPSPATTVSPRGGRIRPVSMYNLSPTLSATSTPTTSSTSTTTSASKTTKNVPRSLSSTSGAKAKGKIGSIGRSNLSSPTASPTKSEDELKEWIRQVVGDDPSSTTYQQPVSDLLRSGVLLCRLANSLRPGVIRRINTPTFSTPTLTPFRQMENLGFFLEACRTFGMKSRQLFDASDLHAGKNLNGVVNTLYSLAQIFQRMEGSKVPTLVQRGEKEGIAEKKLDSASKPDLKSLFNQPVSSPFGSPPSSGFHTPPQTSTSINSSSTVTTPPISPNSPAVSYTVSSSTTTSSFVPVANTLTPTSTARGKRSPPTSPNRTNPGSPRKRTS